MTSAISSTTLSTEEFKWLQVDLLPDHLPYDRGEFKELPWRCEADTFTKGGWGEQGVTLWSAPVSG